MSRVYRLWFYMRRGYATYLAIAVNVVNFISIQYYVLVERLGLLWFIPNIYVFAALMLPALLALTITLGWIDAHKGVIKTETSIVGSQNPWIQEILRTVKKIEAEVRK